MSGNIPFLLKPAAKDYLWGGRRLNDEFNKGIDVYPLAETWECSTHPDGMSLVASGTDAGKPLIQVLRERPDYLGTHPLQIMSGKPELPVLIKLIDATQDMSVQVHPDDAYALENENCLGKTEMWYVLAVRKGASLVYGFNQDMDRERVQNALADGTIEKYLNRVPVRENDVFFVEAGTVHAIGAGIIMAEIQESSNLTYRLYDYGRVDRNGKQRELHVEKAMKALDNHLKSVAEPFGHNERKELTYTTKLINDTATYTNKSKTIECFSLVRGQMRCDGVDVPHGSTILLWPGETLNTRHVELAFVTKMREDLL